MKGERMPQVMKAWLEASPILALHSGMTTQPTEDGICGPSCYFTSGTGDEERGIGLG